MEKSKESVSRGAERTI
ncbi:MAG: hypothetical protein ACIPMY_04495 [Rickettsia endosymbiont of Pentastiridius leporinus]